MPEQTTNQKTGVELIAIERKRQIEELGYDYTNDSLYANEQLAKAGAWYSLPTFDRIRFESMQIKNPDKHSVINIWPWDRLYYKPTPEDRIKELTKAGALIAAQIDYYQNKQITESGIQLSKGMLVYFIGEKAPMEVKAVNENFAICTRPLHRWYDADLLKHKVEMGAYITFTEAYNDLKNEMIYTIIDFKRNIKAPHNLVLGGYDFKKQKDIDKLLEDLQTGQTELSERNKAVYDLDFERTLNQ